MMCSLNYSYTEVLPFACLDARGILLLLTLLTGLLEEPGIKTRILFAGGLTFQAVHSRRLKQSI